MAIKYKANRVGYAPDHLRNAFVDALNIKIWESPANGTKKWMMILFLGSNNAVTLGELFRERSRNLPDRSIMEQH